MNISLNWLKELLTQLEVKGQELADKMSTTGIEVEGVTQLGAGLKKIVVAEVLSCVDHPDSDHLHITQVLVGPDLSKTEDGQLQVVCGAPNIAAGQKVILALPGARIKDNIKIKKGKIRGQVSNGMICSLQELGLEDAVVPKAYADGIYVLPADAPVGANVLDYLQLNDAVLELSITPNRADALSMYGTAYEVGAIYDQKPVFPHYEAPVDENDQVTNYVASVTVEDTEACPAYYMSVIKDVTIQESPQWLQNRLMAIGVRPINNVVDVTNYMLFLYGQPLHAFDYQTLPAKEITVRLAKAGEKLTTLDDVQRDLEASDLVISSNNEAIALAGVMGGLDTEITAKTTTVALETALFNPKGVRETSKRLNLRSESSMRYEKGINQGNLAHVAQEAAAMIALLGQGVVVSGQVFVDTLKDASLVQVKAQVSHINKALGTNLSQAEVTQILQERLGFGVNLEDADCLQVTIPSRRWDISIEADIIEEVARIYGYDKLPSTLPLTASIRGGMTPLHAYSRLSRRLLEGQGFTQTIGYSLTSPDKANLLAKEGATIALTMPMSEERSVLRRSLLTSLLDVASYNAARSQNNLALYEIGRIYDGLEDKAQGHEEEHVALLLTGNRSDKTWYGKAEKVDFFDLKGALDSYFESLGVQEAICYEAAQLPDLHPGQTARIYLDDQEIGLIAQVHPSLAKAYDLGPVFVAEFALEPLVALEKAPLVQRLVPRFPAMERDIAILVDEAVSHAQIVGTIKAHAGAYLVDVALFDQYAGPGIEAGKKSLAYRLTFLNLEATLVEEEVSQAMTSVQEALVNALQASIR